MKTQIKNTMKTKVPMPKVNPLERVSIEHIERQIKYCKERIASGQPFSEYLVMYEKMKRQKQNENHTWN